MAIVCVLGLRQSLMVLYKEMNLLETIKKLDYTYKREEEKLQSTVRDYRKKGTYP
jgi:hypothetical protein